MQGARSPVIAALLSLLLPGLGQLYVGRPRRALPFLLPALIGVGLLIGAIVAGPLAVIGYLVQPVVATLALVGIALLLVIHGIALIDAWALDRRGQPRRRAGGAALAVLGLALAVLVVAYALPGSYVYSLAVHLPRFLTGVNDIPTPSWQLSPSPVGSAGEEPTPASGPPSPRITAAPSPTVELTPAPSPSGSPLSGPGWASNGRLDVLILGSDAGPGRWSARPDAVLMVSVDIESGDAALFAFPRYTNNIPMPAETAEMFKDGRFPGYLNALYVAALNNPRRFPYNDEAGWGVMAGVVQELAGVEIDGYLVVDLLGFERMLDELGGLFVEVPPPGVVDSRYGLGTGRRVSMRLDAGCQELNGRRSLFFSRSRHQDGDIARLGRQLVTLQSLRRSYDPLEVLPRIPALLKAGGDGFHTTFGPADMPALAQVAARVDPDLVRKVVFTSPEFPRALPGDTVERMHEKVRGIFDEPSPEPEGVDCPPR